MSKRESYIFYRNWWESFKSMPNELRLQIYDSIMQYAFERSLDDIPTVAMGFVNMARPLLDKDFEKYEAICKRNKANGLNGGRPKNPEKPKNNPENPVGSLGYDTETQQNPEKPYNDKMINDKMINEDNIESKDSLSVVTDLADKVNYMEIVDFYNNSAKSCNITSCVKLTEKRKSAIRARLKEFGKEKIYEAITKVMNSSFCNGKNDSNWKADFDFVFNANKMTRILEGKYDNKTIRYGNNGNSNEQSIRKVGEAVLGEIFEEIKERRRTEGTSD